MTKSSTDHNDGKVKDPLLGELVFELHSVIGSSSQVVTVLFMLTLALRTSSVFCEENNADIGDDLSKLSS